MVRRLRHDQRTEVRRAQPRVALHTGRSGNTVQVFHPDGSFIEIDGRDLWADFTEPPELPEMMSYLMRFAPTEWRSSFLERESVAYAAQMLIDLMEEDLLSRWPEPDES